MKNDISSIELKFIVDEMQSLTGARFDKIVQTDAEISLQFYATGRGNFVLRIVPGKFFYITSKKASGGEQHNFMMRIRKRLPIATLKGVRQIGSERIIELELENKEGKYRMYAELYGRGNVVLCDKDNKVIAVLDRQLIEDQQKDGKEMVYVPPKKDLNIFDTSEAAFEKLKQTEQPSLVKAMAIGLNIGGVYSEEICLSAGIDKNSDPKTLSKKDITILFSSFKGMIARKPSPKLVSKAGKVINIIPFDMRIYSGKEFEAKDYPTFNEAIDDFLSSNTAEEKTHEMKQEKNKNLVKTQNIIDAQTKSLAHAEKEMKENREKGERIYEDYQLIKGILDEMNRARAKYSWAEIKEKLKGHKIIKSVNEKDKKIVIEI